MRLHALALAAFLVFPPATTMADDVAGGWHPPQALAQEKVPAFYQTGSAITVGMREDRAAYLKLTAVPAGPIGLWRFMERRIPLDTWRGKRLRLSLRLKSEGKAGAHVSTRIEKSNEVVIGTNQQSNKRGNPDWQAHQFVLNIPDNATELVIRAGLTGEGTAWLDSVKLEAVGPDVRLTESWRWDPWADWKW